MLHKTHLVDGYPIDRLAVKVTRLNGVKFEPQNNKKGSQVESANILPVRQPKTKAEMHQLETMKGKRVGRLVIIGLYLDHRSKLPYGGKAGHNQRKPWVCRCACGRYCIRRTETLRKSLRKPQQYDCCQYCKKMDAIRRKNDWQREGRNVVDYQEAGR